jgi:hypothetical protein
MIALMAKVHPMHLLASLLWRSASILLCALVEEVHVESLTRLLV